MHKRLYLGRSAKDLQGAQYDPFVSSHNQLVLNMISSVLGNIMHILHLILAD